MKISKITHHNKVRIRVDFPYNAQTTALLRQIPDTRWSKTLKAWYIPYTKEAFKQLKEMFPDVEYATDVEMRYVETWQAVETQHVETQHVETRHVETRHATSLQPEFIRNDFLVINTSNRTLRLYFSYTYNVEISKQVKQIPLCNWNTDKRCWEIPYSIKFLDQVKQIAAQFVLNFNYIEEKKLKVLPRKSKHDIEHYRSCPQNYVNKLTELRHSQNTIDVYSDMFEEFINYYEDYAIEDITEPMIMDFLLYLVNTRHVSTAYQNQSINAVKFYFERVMGGKRKVYMINRPREEKFLPEVLSQEEVTTLLNATDNLKHKAILMTIYSVGLRISEARNLRIKILIADVCKYGWNKGKARKADTLCLEIKRLRYYENMYRFTNSKNGFLKVGIIINIQLVA